MCITVLLGFEEIHFSYSYTMQCYIATFTVQYTEMLLSKFTLFIKIYNKMTEYMIQLSSILNFNDLKT